MERTVCLAPALPPPPAGTVVRSEVAGALKMRAYLSGMPECKLGLNDKVGRSSAGAA